MSGVSPAFIKDNHDQYRVSQKKVGFRMVPISPGASVEHLIEISMPKNRPIDSKFFLFILRGSKKIVKNFICFRVVKLVPGHRAQVTLFAYQVTLCVFV